MEEVNTSTIRQSFVYGILALSSRTFLLNIISYIASLIVFTALSPREVGIYTAVIAMQRIISFFTDVGFGAAIVQKKENPTQDELSTAFSIQALITGAIFIIVFLLRNLLRTYFKLDMAGETLLLVLVFTIFVSSFKSIPSILLERKIHFHKLIIPQIVEALVFNILLIVLLLGKSGLYSFSWAFFVSSLAGLPFYYIISPWEPKFAIEKKSLSHLRFGLAFQAKNILATLKDDLLTVFLTKFLTFSEIGYIGFAQRNAFLFFRYAVDSVTRVSFPAYARVQHDKELLKIGIEKTLFYVSAAMSPVGIGAIVIMPYIIEYFPKWHNKWEPAIFSFVFFSLNALVSSFSNILVNALDATGRVRVTLKLMVIWTVLTWVLTVILLKMFGYNGVAAASFLVTLTIGYTIYLVKKLVPFSFTASVYKPVIAALIMASFVYILSNTFAKSFPLVVLIVLFGALIYSIVMYIIAKDNVQDGIKLVLNKK